MATITAALVKELRENQLDTKLGLPFHRLLHVGTLVLNVRAALMEEQECSHALLTAPSTRRAR